MAASAKKKKDKKKDFQKTKHKVGKAAPKPSNVTNTSFKAKSITVRQQTISTTALSASSQFIRYLSLVNHKIDSQKREAVAFLTSAITTTPPGTPLAQPVSIILEKVQPLVVDGSSGVRTQLLKLLQALPATEVGTRSCETFLFYVRAAMTHLSVEIRSSSLDFLEWLLQVDGNGVVSCGGGWIKTLECFLGLLGWREQNAAGTWSASSEAPVHKASSEGKIMAKRISSLASFVRAGIAPEMKLAATHDHSSDWFPLVHTEAHLISKRSNPYAYLNLFGAPPSNDMEMYEDREDRQRVFHDRYERIVVAGIARAQKEAGEVGRASALLRKVINEGMADFEDE